MIKNDMESYQPDDTKLNGIYRGVVEDNSSDPEKSGKCKIRVFGIHTPNKGKTGLEGIPADELPWAEPVMGLFEGSVTGFGSWTVPLQGSHVFLFFENGNILEPRYFATVPSIPEDQNHGFKEKQGFSDPNKEFPNKETKAPHRPNQLNEPDLHRLARGEITDTIVESKEEKKDTGIDTALGGSWDEPDPYYNAQYPDNKVFATRTGITVEIDDTESNERIHIYHPSNTYIEINNEGNVILRNANDKFEIVDNDKKEHVRDNYDRTVDTDRTSKVGENEKEEIGVDRTREIGNDNNDTIGNDENKNIGNNQVVTIDTNKNVTIKGNYQVNIKGTTTITSIGTTTVNGSNVNLNADKGALGKIVTTNHICAFTGLPHPDGSSTCNAHK